MGPAYWILNTAVLVSLLVLVVVISYFAQKEYTSEIERLRRDLAATRDKSGVYVAPENYTQMIMQLEQQEQEISQMLSHIKALKEEMDKKEDLCNQLNISLDSCNQKLVATVSELEVTQDKLNETSVKLQDVANRCTEKEHLIEKHMHTERTLTTQAASLLAVADMASSDVGKLHDKLARKRSIDDVNQEVSKKYHLKFMQHMAYMEDSLNRFIQDLMTFCFGLQTNLGERLKKRSDELTSLSNEISSFVDSQIVQIQNLEMISFNKVQNDQKWIKQYLTSVSSTADSETSHLHRFLVDTFLVPMRNLAHQLHLQEAENQELNQIIVTQIQQKLDAVRNFETAQSEGLSKLRENILLLTGEQQQALECSQEGYRGMCETLSEYKKTLLPEVEQLKSMADRILSIHEYFENQCNDNKNKINNGLSLVQEKCNHLSQQSSTILDLQQKRSEHLITYEAQTEELFKKVSTSRERAEQLSKITKQLGEDVEDRVHSAVSHGEQAWKNHFSWTEQELRKYSENVNADFQKELKQTEILMNGLRAFAESHEAALELQRVDFGTFVHDHQDDLQNHCSYIGGWSQTITTGLQQYSEDLNKFLDEDLQKDMPTGNTPQHRDFSYPRVLAATSPHEQILARFREVNGAIIPHLPIAEVGRSPSGSSSIHIEASSSVTESLKDVPFRSASVTDIPNAADLVLNISHHSEPESLKQRNDKENSTTTAMKKHHSDDLRYLKTRKLNSTSKRKVLQPQN